VALPQQLLRLRATTHFHAATCAPIRRGVSPRLRLLPATAQRLPARRPRPARLSHSPNGLPQMSQLRPTRQRDRGQPHDSDPLPALSRAPTANPANPPGGTPPASFRIARAATQACPIAATTSRVGARQERGAGTRGHWRKALARRGGRRPPRRKMRVMSPSPNPLQERDPEPPVPRDITG